uniref:UBR-type domain-containing protein n=1 Tax=Sexangularia sp. CB-2014 TaxID=1486929 RepID=A0A7S1VMP6_9EUKA
MSLDLENCTLPLSLDSQPIFSCLTCGQARGRPTGVCLACATACHAGHRLLDLYEKRSFTCDCQRGDSFTNSDTKTLQCRLLGRAIAAGRVSATACLAISEAGWPANRYGQNFGGRYCVCHREYNEEEERAMIQCSGCQDWFHQGVPCVSQANAGLLLAGDTSKLGFICADCMVGTGQRLLAPYIAAVGTVVPINSQTGPEVPQVDGAKTIPPPSHDTVAPGTVVSLADVHTKPDSPFRSARVHLYGNFAEVLCHCDECRAAFARVGWEHLLDDLVDVAAHDSDEDSDDDGEGLADEGASSLLGTVLNSLPQDGVVRRQVAGVVSDFVEVFKTLQGEVTVDDVPAIMDQIRERKRARDEEEGTYGES